MKTTAIVLGVVVVIALYFVFLAGGHNEYSDTDSREVTRSGLFQTAERLLADSESWPVELEAEGVTVSSSLDPYPARAVRYAVEVNAPLEDVIDYIKAESYSGPGRRDKPDKEKYEVTLHQIDKDGEPYEWVRRSVHLSPPPGGNRDAVVMYLEDRPRPEDLPHRLPVGGDDRRPGAAGGRRRRALQGHAVDVQGRGEGAGQVLVRKVEGVDPRGALSAAMNNYFISLMFFRAYMFEQAKDLRARVGKAQG